MATDLVAALFGVLQDANTLAAGIGESAEVAKRLTLTCREIRAQQHLHPTPLPLVLRDFFAAKRWGHGPMVPTRMNLAGRANLERSHHTTSMHLARSCSLLRG